MRDWQTDVLKKIAESDDLHIAPLREDGVTFGTPTWIWSVVVGNALFVRAYSGPSSRWYVAAINQKAGRIKTAGMTLDVVFTPSSGPINDQIDSAYRAKYAKSPYLASMIGQRAQAATVRIDPST